MLGYQNFLPDASRVQSFFNSSKIPSALVPRIKNDYSLIELIQKKMHMENAYEITQFSSIHESKCGTFKLSSVFKISSLQITIGYAETNTKYKGWTSQIELLEKLTTIQNIK